MSATECEDVVGWLTALFALDPVKEQLRGLRVANATSPEFIDAIASMAGPDRKETILREFAELPEMTVTTILDAWAMADRAGKSFAVKSVRPDRPIAFAHSRRVRLTVDAEDDGVRVLLSHVPNRHAPWYSPVAVFA